MPFKQYWEKTSAHHTVTPQEIKEMMELAFPMNTIVSFQLLAGGCANLNFQILLKHHSKPYLLRIYIRDKDAACREEKLGALMKGIVTVPDTYFVGEHDTRRFALTEFMSGIPLRDYLLGNDTREMEPLMFKVGEALSKIQTVRFPRSGFFDQDLNIMTSLMQQGYVDFAHECLSHSTTREVLGEVCVLKIKTIVNTYGALFPKESDNYLAHGDFDPANILVQNIRGKWEISAILDWEFSYSGSPLQDVSSMLRYAHKMPKAFEDAFLTGLQSGGIRLPKDWKMCIHLLNILSLLSCLVRWTPLTHPYACKDACELIQYFTGKFFH